MITGRRSVSTIIDINLVLLYRFPDINDIRHVGPRIPAAFVCRWCPVNNNSGYCFHRLLFVAVDRRRFRPIFVVSVHDGNFRPFPSIRRFFRLKDRSSFRRL
jgi:hypothetical protein